MVFDSTLKILTHPESESLPESCMTAGFRTERCDGVSGPVTDLESLPDAARRETCLIPAFESTLHCNEQKDDMSWRCREHTMHCDAPTAPFGGRGCGLRRRKTTLELLITYAWMPVISASRDISAILTTSWYDDRRTCTH